MARRWIAAAGVVTFAAIALVAYLYTRSDARRHASAPETVDMTGSSGHRILEQLAQVEQTPAYFQSTTRNAKKVEGRDSFRKGMEIYAEAKYKEAVPLLEGAAGKEPNHDAAVFYLGICYLMTDRIEESVRELAKLTTSISNPYCEESHWYLAKAYLKKDDLASARKELESVVTMNGVYVNEARKSLQLMEGLGRNLRK